MIGFVLSLKALSFQRSAFASNSSLFIRTARLNGKTLVALGLLLLFLFAVRIDENLIDETVFERFARVHVTIAFGLAGDLLGVLAAVFRQDLNQQLFVLEDFFRLDANVLRLPGDAAVRL